MLQISSGYLQNITILFSNNITTVLNQQISSIIDDLGTAHGTTLSVSLIQGYDTPAINFNATLQNAFTGAFVSNIDQSVQSMFPSLSITVIQDFVDYIMSLLFVTSYDNFTPQLYQELLTAQGTSFQTQLQNTIQAVLTQNFVASGGSYKINDNTYTYQLINSSAILFQLNPNTPLNSGESVMILIAMFMLVIGVGLFVFFMKAEIVGYVYKQDFKPNTIVIEK